MTLLPVNLPTVKIRTIILRAVSPSKGDKGQELSAADAVRGDDPGVGRHYGAVLQDGLLNTAPHMLELFALKI